MDHVHRLSEAVYVGLCYKFGSPTELRMRREVMNIAESVRKPMYMMKGYDRMKSVGVGEGFRIKTSDLDLMFCILDHRVIPDASHISLYCIPQHTVILMECDDFPPGFTKLNLMSPSHSVLVRSSCVAINNKVYISSKLFREHNLGLLQTLDCDTALSIAHGPCSTFVSVGGFEADFAYCFWSQLWPPKALPWIHRCHQHGWPSENVVTDILKGGFHVVPIGSTPAGGEEWRISFSRAEQKLVFAMNHSQFLFYGLFKIFLKEVINFQNNSPTLCSYFTKTAVFWVIQTKSFLTWKPVNLLYCFWECFKLLIYWVHIGDCPNFFYATAQHVSNIGACLPDC